MNKNIGKALMPFGKSILGIIVKINTTAHEPTLLRMNQPYCAWTNPTAREPTLLRMNQPYCAWTNPTAHLPGAFHKNQVFLVFTILSYLSDHMQDVPDPGDWKESSAMSFRKSISYF